MKLSLTEADPLVKGVLEVCEGAGCSAYVDREGNLLTHGSRSYTFDAFGDPEEEALYVKRWLGRMHENERKYGNGCHVDD